jgi:hypothetical protein
LRQVTLAVGSAAAAHGTPQVPQSDAVLAALAHRATEQPAGWGVAHVPRQSGAETLHAVKRWSPPQVRVPLHTPASDAGAHGCGSTARSQKPPRAVAHTPVLGRHKSCGCPPIITVAQV